MTCMWSFNEVGLVVQRDISLAKGNNSNQKGGNLKTYSRCTTTYDTDHVCQCFNEKVSIV